MDDLFDHPSVNHNAPAAAKATDTLTLDPKLLPRALKKMQGLVRGNGISTKDVTLSTENGDITVEMYRFAARTFLKLVPEYGIRMEPGRNTKAELMASQAEFNLALSQTVIDARTTPEKRKQIIDFIFSRADKGFGIKEQRIKFHQLSRDFVQHEKCLPCKNTGRVGCGKCHGHGTLTCINCQGRRQVVCPRCRGTTKVQSNRGTIPCQHCRADGKINCLKCAGRGQTKCQTCAASGSLQCQPCTGTGWMSHLAHIEIYAQMHFDFDRANLPTSLVGLIEKAASRLVEKNDIEVSLKEGWAPPEKSIRGDSIPVRKEIDSEPDDTIWLDYDAICPYGPVTFKLKERIISANLFGFQARLNDCPPFLNDLTKVGQQALIDAATGQGEIIIKIQRAAKYTLLRDVIVQTLRIRNLRKAHQLLLTKYTAGINPEQLEKLVKAADLSIRHITRKSRITGLILGLGIFSLLALYYFMMDGRASLLAGGLSEQSLWVSDAMLTPLGILMGIYGSKLAALWSQNSALKDIVPKDVLNRTLPKIGKILWWSIAGSITITIGVLLATIVMGNTNLPAWVNYLTP